MNVRPLFIKDRHSCLYEKIRGFQVKLKFTIISVCPVPAILYFYIDFNIHPKIKVINQDIPIVILVDNLH